MLYEASVHLTEALRNEQIETLAEIMEDVKRTYTQTIESIYYFASEQMV